MFGFVMSDLILQDSFMEVASPVTDYAVYQFGTSGAGVAVATTVTHPLGQSIAQGF